MSPLDDRSRGDGPTDGERDYLRHDTSVSRVHSILHHPLLRSTLRSAIAAGLAYEIGSFLPLPLGEYPNYAALGALTVLLPVVRDSAWEALRVTGAVLVGVLLAMATQAIAWPNAVTVGVVIAVGTAIGVSRVFGGQRLWVPLAGLFVLTVHGQSTDVYGLAYLAQIALGAVVALLVNLAHPPLPLHEVATAVTRMRKLLVGQLREMVDMLRGEEPPPRGRWNDQLGELSTPREQVATLARQAQRARSANLRTRRWDSVQNDLMDLAEVMQRCTRLIENLGVVLTEFEQEGYSILGDGLRTATADALEALADVLDKPWQAAPDSPLLRRAEKVIDALLDQVDAEEFEQRADRYLAGALAVTARRCLHTFARRYGGAGGAE